MPLNLFDYLERQRSWSLRTFGEGKRTVDFLADEEVIEGFVCLSDNVHDYAWKYLGDESDRDESKSAYRSGFRDMVQAFKDHLEKYPDV